MQDVTVMTDEEFWDWFGHDIKKNDLTSPTPEILEKHLNTIMASITNDNRPPIVDILEALPVVMDHAKRCRDIEQQMKKDGTWEKLSIREMRESILTRKLAWGQEVTARDGGEEEGYTDADAERALAAADAPDKEELDKSGESIVSFDYNVILSLSIPPSDRH